MNACFSEGEWLNGFLDSGCENEFNKLIAKAKTGDNKAFESLMNSYIKTIYNYILMHVAIQEDAKDLLQEVMLGIWRSMSGFDQKSSFKTWIIGITRRKIADFYRRYYRHNANQTVDITEYAHELCSEQSIDRVLDQITVENAMDTLSKEDKEIVYLIFNAQLTYKQVENITGIPEGTIKSRMHTIRIKLKKQLKEVGGNAG